MNEWKGRRKAIERIVMVQDDGLCGTVVSGGAKEALSQRHMGILVAIR